MSYNIAFFADTHIGYRARVRNTEKGINTRVQDGYDALRETVTQIIRSEGEDKVDAVVCGGDLFHTSHPSIRDISTVQWYLRLLSKHNIPFYGLAGNHDATDVRSDLASVAAVDDPDRKIYALYQPYKAYNLTDGILLHAMSHHGLSADLAPTVKSVEGEINLFTTHGAALDPKNQSLLRCAESPREQFVPMEMVTDLSFAAKLLGHYHSRYAVGGEQLNTWYSGSTLRRGFSDAPGERGWLLVKVDPDGSTTVHPRNISQRPQYDLEAIDAEGLSASDVMDLLEINIRRTLDASSAPIVRQRILNTSRGVREGLDQQRIADLTKHTLLWQLEKIRPDAANEITSPEGRPTATLAVDKKHSLDVIESFNGWAKDQGKNVPEQHREVVVREAEEYLKQAKAAATDALHSH